MSVFSTRCMHNPVQEVRAGCGAAVDVRREQEREARQAVELGGCWAVALFGHRSTLRLKAKKPKPPTRQGGCPLQDSTKVFNKSQTPRDLALTERAAPLSFSAACVERMLPGSSPYRAESSESTPRRRPLPALVPPQPAALPPLVDIDSLKPVPLRDVVHRLLEEWDVESISSEDDDDFCGWRVGSRALPAPGEPARAPSRAARRPSVPAAIAGPASRLSGFFGGGTAGDGDGGRPPGSHKCVVS